jgi:integrase
MTGKKNPPLVFEPVPAGAPLTFDLMAQAPLEDYVLQQYRTLNSIRARVEYLRGFFGGWPAETITTDTVRQYQLHRRAQGAAAATINRELQALHRMLHVAVQRDLLARLPEFPTRLQENPPRQGFFKHEEYLKVRAVLPSAFQDVLDFAYYWGWRRNEILYLAWTEVDLPGGVIRLSPHRSKTRAGRVLPISAPLRQVLERRRARRIGDEPGVFRRDGVPVRTWRHALRDACRQPQVPPRLLHDCRRTAARNLNRAGVPERVAMILTGHKTRSVFDRYNIVNERELFSAGGRLVAYLHGAPLTTDLTARRQSARRKTAVVGGACRAFHVDDPLDSGQIRAGTGSLDAGSRRAGFHAVVSPVLEEMPHRIGSVRGGYLYFPTSRLPDPLQPVAP